MIKNELDNCKCDDKECKRHGKCEECIEFHKDKEKPVYCKREKKSIS